MKTAGYETRLGLRLLLGVYWTALFVATHLPSDLVPSRVDAQDKLIHVAAYLVLTVLCGMAWRLDAHRSPVAWLQMALLLLGYAAADEFLQKFVPGRHAEFLDWLADGIGVAAGVLALHVGVALRRRTAPGWAKRAA